MQKAISIFIFLFCGIVTYAQTANPNYDDALAKKLGADDYGMKQYTSQGYDSIHAAVLQDFSNKLIEIEQQRVADSIK